MEKRRHLCTFLLGVSLNVSAEYYKDYDHGTSLIRKS